MRYTGGKARQDENKQWFVSWPTLPCPIGPFIEKDDALDFIARIEEPEKRLYASIYSEPIDTTHPCKHESTRPSSGGCICNECGWRSW